MSEFHQPYNDVSLEAKSDGSQSKMSTTNQIMMLKNHTIFQRAISSANKHGIHLEPGRENNGYGNSSIGVSLSFQAEIIISGIRLKKFLFFIQAKLGFSGRSPVFKIYTNPVKLKQA